MSIRFFTKWLPILYAVVLVSICISCNPSRQNTNQSTAPQTAGAQHGHNPYPFINQKYFTRVWTGTQWCNGDTTGTDFKLTVSAKDSVNVYVAGFNNSKAAVVGKVRGYLVIIDPQTIKGPTGNYLVEGTLALTNDHDILRGFYTSKSSNHTDSCKVAFKAMK